jgi:hypothetical protein
MSDQTLEQHDDGQHDDEDVQDGGKNLDDKPIPYSRFEEVNKRAKKAEQELQELRDRILDFEDRDKSEAERDKARAERAERELSQMMQKVTGLEKGSWVRSAAAELNFHDPEDAVSHLMQNLAGFEDQRDAKRAVQQLARSKKHLVRDEKAQPERSPLTRVFSGDQAQQQQSQGGRAQKSPQQLSAEREMELAQGLAQHLGQFRDRWREFGGIG